MPARRAAKSPEARTVLRELEKELVAASVSQGRTLVLDCSGECDSGSGGEHSGSEMADFGALRGGAGYEPVEGRAAFLAAPQRITTLGIGPQRQMTTLHPSDRATGPCKP